VRFFEELAQGSEFHKAIKHQDVLRIEASNPSPNGHLAFQLILEAFRKAAQTQNGPA
jgi:hypothetical protein